MSLSLRPRLLEGLFGEFAHIVCWHPQLLFKWRYAAKLTFAASLSAVMS
jgi:hypothetical protein